MFERQTYFLSQEMDTLQAKHFPGLPPIEFHATEIRSGKAFWRKIDPAVRGLVIQDIGQVVANANALGLFLFAAVIEKSASIFGEDAVKLATEQICGRFDMFLARREDAQRGLLVFAESHYQQRAKLWVRGFRALGTQWGILRNLSDIPYFASTKESRLLQLADYVSHAFFLLYERGDASLAKAIISRLDQRDGILHGLVHAPHQQGRLCECPACFSRKTPYSFGPWLA